MNKVLQINLNHCETIQNQPTQTVREENIDVVVIADSYNNLDHPDWLTDKSGTTVL